MAGRVRISDPTTPIYTPRTSAESLSADYEDIPMAAKNSLDITSMDLNIEEMGAIKNDEVGDDSEAWAPMNPAGVYLAAEAKIATDLTLRHSDYQNQVERAAQLVTAAVGGGGELRNDIATQGGVLSNLMRAQIQQQEVLRKSDKRKKKVKNHLRGTNKQLPERPLPKNSASFLTLKSALSEPSYIVPRHVSRSTPGSRTQTPSTSRRNSLAGSTVSLKSSKPSSGLTLQERIQVTYAVANVLQKHAFMLSFARALIKYGSPKHRLESSLKLVAKSLHIKADFFYIPNLMLISFQDSQSYTSETNIVSERQGLDMMKLLEVHRLSKLISHEEVTIDEAVRYMEQIENSSDFFPKILTVLSYAITSFTASAMFFGGTWAEAGVAAALGTLLSLWETISDRYASLQPMFEITCSILIGFIARGATRGGFSFVPVSFGGIVMLLPGFSMTCAIVELASHYVITGIIHLVYALIYSFLLGYGLSMGSGLWMTFDSWAAEHQNDPQGNGVDKLWNFLLVPMFALGMSIWLKIRPSRWWIAFFTAGAGYVCALLLTFTSAPNQVIQATPALVIGLIGNLYGRLRQETAFDAVLLAVNFLVPGSVGLRSGLALMSGDLGGQGASFALAMIETAISLAVGLFVATILTYPNGALNTPIIAF